MRVLLIDDEPGIAIPISRALQSRGHESEYYKGTNELMEISDDYGKLLTYVAFSFEAVLTDFTLYPSPLSLIRDIHRIQKEHEMPLIRAVFYCGGNPPRGYQAPENSLWLLKPQGIFSVVDTLVNSGEISRQVA